MRRVIPILLLCLCSCLTPKRIADPLPPIPVFHAAPDATPIFAAMGQPLPSVPCVTRWGKPCVNATNLYTGRLLLTWTEAAPVFEYGVYSSTNVLLPVGQWARLTNTTAHVVPITANDAQRFFYVRWTNTIDRSSGFVL